ncbi:MAG: DUF1989 domain-containing protein [Deltaproteobacteria bacterium]|nr:DUF1989 domain-containing protein [Deltaproteobacteria bacterium]
MLTFVHDGSPGYHDAQFSACVPFMYKLLGFEGGAPELFGQFSPRCSGGRLATHQEPDPINFFQRTPVSADGGLHTAPAATRPGDSVTLRAEVDLILVVTACSMDLKNINGDRCTAIGIEIL